MVAHRFYLSRMLNISVNKFDFDYYVKRAEVLTEMARPSPWVQGGSEAGSTIKSIFDSVGKVMSRGGEVNGEFVPGMGGNRYVNRALRYIIFLLSGIDEASDSDEVGDDEANHEIISAACNILGIPKEGWRKVYNDPDKLYRAAITKSITDHADKIMSPEFKQKALDNNNILNYVANNRITNAFSYTAGQQRSERHGGMSPEDIDAAQTSIKDLLTKIHKAQFYKRKKKNPELAQKEAEGGAEISNDFIDNAFLITDALEVLIDNGKHIQQTVNAQLSKFRNADEDTKNDILNDLADDYPHLTPEYIHTLYGANIKLLETLHDAYSKLHASGIDMGDFNNKIEQFKSKNPESIKKLMDLWLYEIGELQSSLGLLDKYDVEPDKSEFPGYDQEILDAVLVNPGDKEKFAKFHRWLQNEMIGKTNKIQEQIHAIKWGDSEIPGEKEQMRRGFQSFLDKRPQLKKQGASAEASAVQQQLGKAPTNKAPSRPMNIPIKPNARKEREEEDEETIEESAVMHYMTEQVSKDRFQPKGEFKERGCKKLNYHDWIVRYQ